VGPDPPPHTLLGRQLRGVLSWNITDLCNYRCAYCTQRTMAERTRSLGPLPSVLAALDRLPGRWEIKLSGGEPFEQPGLVELCQDLVARGHVISIQTNFSAPPELVTAFLDATRGSLHTFSASLHLDHATPQQFLERRGLLAPYEADGLRFHVTSVATEARLRELRDHVAPLLARHGVVFKVQPQKVDGYVRPYDEEQRRMLHELGGHNLTGVISHDFQGRLCHAGSRYLVIKSSGQAYRCYPASRLGGRYARLGSLAQGLQLLDGPRICPYPCCNCTVPIDRGMIVGREEPCSSGTSMFVTR